MPPPVVFANVTFGTGSRRLPPQRQHRPPASTILPLQNANRSAVFTPPCALVAAASETVARTKSDAVQTDGTVKVILQSHRGWY